MNDGNYSKIPANMSGALVRYVMYGLRPGSALAAILSNDLKEAVACCDEDSWAGVQETVFWLHNYAPSNCHGSKEKVEAWRESDLSGFSELRDGLKKFVKNGCKQSANALDEVFA